MYIKQKQRLICENY